MKFLVVLAVAVACASADVSHVVKGGEADAPVLKSNFDIDPSGSYQFEYETGNGISAQEQGVVKNQNSEYPSIDVNGAFRYTAPNGEPIQVTYVADENGFQPSGSHLPVGPEIPEAILRSLAYIAAHPPPAEASFKASPPKPAYG